MGYCHVNNKQLQSHSYYLDEEITMFKLGDRVEYWYRMGRVGTIVGTKDSEHHAMLEGGTLATQVLLIVKFDDGMEELYPSSELRLADE